MLKLKYDGFGKTLWLYLLLGCAVVCAALAGVHFALRFDPAKDGTRLGRPVMSLEGGGCEGVSKRVDPAETSAPSGSA